jgi:hypothetical protein
MNTLDDLMAVWRSQDAAPLHGVNETLLGLALRQDEKKLRKQRRREEWTTYAASAGMAAALAFILWVMTLKYSRNDVITAWDFAVPVAGLLAALVWGGALYLSRRSQMRLEQSFGGSLRDQLRLHMAQLDYQMSGTARLANMLVATLPPLVCTMAFLLAMTRINAEPGDPLDMWTFGGPGFENRLGGWVMIVIVVGTLVYGAWDSLRQKRRQAEQELLPRKRHLETMLKELES